MDNHISDRGIIDGCVTRCESSCKRGCSRNPKSFNIGRSDGFLLFRNWRITPVNISFDIWLSSFLWGSVVPAQTNNSVPNHKLYFNSPLFFFLILISGLMSLPATPFWFLYKSHSHWNSDSLRLLCHGYLDNFTHIFVQILELCPHSHYAQWYKNNTGPLGCLLERCLSTRCTTVGYCPFWSNEVSTVVQITCCLITFMSHSVLFIAADI